MRRNRVLATNQKKSGVMLISASRRSTFSN
jgi:hypothetical protein